MNKQMQVKQYLYGFVLPALMVALILVVDLSEGTKSSYVGLLACVPPLAAVLGTTRMVAIIGVLALVVAGVDSAVSSDGDLRLQRARIIIIGLVSLLAVGATRIRVVNERRMVSMIAELAEAKTLEKHAVTDYLTGQPNRYGLLKSVEGADADQATLIIFDFDKFKEINDAYGHLFGDAYIKNVGQRIRDELKGADLFGRWGGDEFVAIILTPMDQAQQVVDRVVKQVISNPFAMNDIDVPVKLSAGIATWDKAKNFDQTFVQADKALYEAKSRGGCRAVDFADLPNHGVGVRLAH